MPYIMYNPKRITILLALLVLTACSLHSAPTICPTPQVCFTPGERCDQRVVAGIDRAQHGILVQAYGFTSKPIIQSLVEAHKRGVSVSVILDKSNLEQKHSGMRTLLAARIPVWIDFKPAIAHNKVMIVDGQTVITGSYR